MLIRVNGSDIVCGVMSGWVDNAVFVSEKKECIYLFALMTKLRLHTGGMHL